MSAAGWNILAADTIDRRLEFAHLPQGWAAVGSVVLLLLLTGAVVTLYRFETRSGVSPRTRFILAGLRCLVVLLLAAIWLEPVLATYITRRIESQTLVLLDQSASMSVKDRYPDAAEAERVRRVLGSGGNGVGEASRAEIVQHVLSSDGERLLREMAGANPVRLYGFGDRLSDLGTVAGDAQAVATSQPQEAPPASQPATDIGRAVRQAVEAQSGSPISAVVVISDGRFNQGEPAEVIGRYARSRKIPIHAVGVGDPAPPRNLSITAVEAPPNVFVKDPFRVVAHVRAQGIENAAVRIELLEGRAGATASVVDTKQATVSSGGRVEPVVFNRQLEQAAEVELTVRIEPAAGETLVEDNQKQATVRALDAKMRVLLVAGAPSWEYRYLSRLLTRDATVNVSCWLQSADENSVRDGNTIIDHFPRTQEELFQYACIILMDPKPGDFDPDWAALVESLVSTTGGGLLYVAGRQNTPRFAHDAMARPVMELLPVAIDPNESDLIINELGHFQSTPWPFTLAPDATGSPVLSLSDQPGESAQVWSRLPGVYWHYPVRREKPAATVFLRHSSPRMRNSYGGHVLLATQFFGSGRTGYLGFDSTWRWRRFGDRYFNRFWIQLIRHMVEGKLLVGQERGMVQVEREKYAVGEPVTIEARLMDPQHLPLKQEQTQATVRVDGKTDRRVVLSAQPNRPGWYRGQLIAAETGKHVIEIELPGAEAGSRGSVRGEFEVGQPDLEFRQPELDRASLQTLASQSAGGRYLDIDEIGQLPSLIPSRTTTLVLTGQPTTLWDRWWMFLLLVGLLAAEWAIRKQVRLL